jgi:hypothetical protein
MASGILNVARNQFQAYLAADTHLARYWINGGPTVTVLQTTASLTSDQASGISDSWVNRRQLGGPAVLDNGLEAKPFGRRADTGGRGAARGRRRRMERVFGGAVLPRAPDRRFRDGTPTSNDLTAARELTLRGYAGPIRTRSRSSCRATIKGRRRSSSTHGAISIALARRPCSWALGPEPIDEGARLGFGLGRAASRGAGPGTPGKPSDRGDRFGAEPYA